MTSLPTENGLLPCPFCGHAPEVGFFLSAQTIHCANVDCGVSSETSASTYEEAVAAWNTRTSAPAGADGWQDISTAPRDGTIILGGWINGEAHTGSIWEDKWVPAWDDAGDWSIPTYWQPLLDLPAPPAPIADEGTKP